MPSADEQKPLRTALLAVVGTWLFAVLAVGVLHSLPLFSSGEPDFWQLRPPALVTVSLGSLIVALVAFVPNLFRPTSMDRPKQQRETTDPAGPGPDNSLHEPPHVTDDHHEPGSDDLTHGPSHPTCETANHDQTDANSLSDKQTSPTTAGDLGWAASFLFGLLIRITGTVALFLFSSYQSLGAPISLAGWILGWHALLLAAEVIALANTIPTSSPMGQATAGPCEA